jgi:lipid-A-disaccharide synthase
VRRLSKPPELARELGLDGARPLVSLLPGSRRNELAENLPVYVASAAALRAWHPGLQLRLLLAPGLQTPPDLPEWLRAVRGRTHEAMAISTALIAAPGTVTVEAMLLGVPLVVAHRAHPLSFELGRRLVRVPSSCMVNLLAERGVVPEFLQDQARPAAIAARVSGWLLDARAREAQREALAGVAVRLGGPGASERAAALLCELAER